jgi:hypothetical protein
MILNYIIVINNKKEKIFKIYIYIKYFNNFMNRKNLHTILIKPNL